MIEPKDPVHRDEKDGYWYFWEETWAHRNGPYRTEEICRVALKIYSEVFLEGKHTQCPCCGRNIDPKEVKYGPDKRAD